MPIKRPWTIIGGATAAVAIGASGLVLSGVSDQGLPGPITLQDGAPVAAEDAPDRSPDGFQVVPNPVFTPGGSADSTDDSPSGIVSSPDEVSFDSPDNSPASFDSPDDSPAPLAAPTAADSPDDSPFAPAPTAADSPDDSPPAPAPTVADSPDDSPDFASADSPDNSPGLSSIDSPDGSG